MVAFEWEAVGAVAGIGAVVVAAVSALIASLSSRRSHRVSERLLVLEERREGRAVLRLEWRKNHDDAYLVRVVNDGPGTAHDVHVELLDAFDNPWIFGPPGQESEDRRGELPPAALVELKTAQHKVKLWMRVRWTWVDGDGEHSTDEIISYEHS